MSSPIAAARRSRTQCTGNVCRLWMGIGVSLAVSIFVLSDLLHPLSTWPSSGPPWLPGKTFYSSVHLPSTPPLPLWETLEGRRVLHWQLCDLLSFSYTFEISSCGCDREGRRRREGAGACVMLSLLHLKFICLYFIPHFSSDEPTPRELTYFCNTVPPSFSL